jgi:hypothetical protein
MGASYYLDDLWNLRNLSAALLDAKRGCTHSNRPACSRSCSLCPARCLDYRFDHAQF